MNLNDFLGSAHRQNAPEYKKSHLPNSLGEDPPGPLSMTTPHQQLSSPATTDTDISTPNLFLFWIIL